VTKSAVVTGASSGIGAATARRLAAEGFDVILGARREDRIMGLAREIGGRGSKLDVTDPDSVREFCAGIDELDVLVNNAGGALGLDRIESADDDHWRVMWESNVLGLVRMTRELLPALERSNVGTIVNVGSIAGIDPYPGGAGYTSVKHGVRAITKTLRMELLGKPIRVVEIAPGLVDTEFSLVRFGGDYDRARAVYRGTTPLSAEDVAECIVFAVTRPPHVNIDHLLVMPRDQATATMVHREEP
jgi:NADP-dependent 3-hydroxy acid dehydrogenase YdfG